MSNEEAIKRLVEAAKQLQPDGDTYIAFEMAVRALDEQKRREDDGK